MPADPHAFIAEYKDQEIDVVFDPFCAPYTELTGKLWSSRSGMEHSTASDFYLTSIIISSSIW